jgi:hypothetical protein
MKERRRERRMYERGVERKVCTKESVETEEMMASFYTWSNSSINHQSPSFKAITFILSGHTSLDNGCIIKVV